MPWHIGNHEDCETEFAVIKDDDGSLAGCHATEAAAKEQLAALYSREASGAMKLKTFDLIETKADEDAAGEFTALASVFGNVDHVGDRMVKGAFSKSLERWRAKGDPIPIVLAHQWDDVMAFIGKADPAKVVETDRGLEVTGQLDLSDQVGRKVYRLFKDRLLKAFSFGYTVPEGGEQTKDGVNEISEVELIEIGPCLKGANPEAQLQAVKAVTEHNVEAQDGLTQEPAGQSHPDPLKDKIDRLMVDQAQAKVGGST